MAGMPSRSPDAPIGVPRAPVIAITAGEPAGIGPDLCVALAHVSLPGVRPVVIGDRALLVERAQQLALSLRCVGFEAGANTPVESGTLVVYHVPLVVRAEPGRLDRRNSASVLRILEAAADGCLNGTFDAMVTTPVHKAIINDAGYAFTGHTEFLAERTGSDGVVMMLIGGGMRVALATTHAPLKEVASSITTESLESVLRVLRKDLMFRFRISEPRIIVAGLNPHAGEGGYLGREEIETIIPVLDKLRAEGFRLVGPLPADTLFQPQHMEGADCVLAMYHDQGLPVLKYASFGAAVNVTLGLPLIRTSVDHGTALDLAGTGKAYSGSLIEAIKLASDLAGRAPVRAG
jgi:4-hydroxythreonine-4-phosphate dehydrogenase